MYILAIRVWVSDPLAGGHDPPPVGAQRCQLRIRIGDRQAQLDRHRDSAGEVDHGLESLRLLRVPHTLPLDPAVVAPVGHRREGRSGGIVGRPFGQHDRPQGLLPANSAGRKGTARLAQVQADREIEVVSPQAHVDAVPRLPNLRVARVQIEVHAAANTPEDRCVSAELVEEEVHVRGDLLDVLIGAAFDDQALDLLGHDHHFVDGEAASITGLPARGATDGAVQRRPLALLQILCRPVRLDQLRLGRLVRLLALVAEPARESLGDHAVERARHEERLDSHLDESQRS